MYLSRDDVRYSAYHLPYLLVYIHKTGDYTKAFILNTALN